MRRSGGGKQYPCPASPSTPAQSAERVRLYKQAQQKAAEIQRKAREKAQRDAEQLADLEAQADQAARDAEAKRDAEREKTPDLRPDGPNMLPKVKKVQTTKDGPMNFVSTDNLTKQQKDELDKIAQDNQKQADDAMGLSKSDKLKQKMQKNKDDYAKKQKELDTDIFKGHTADEIEMIRQDGDNLRALDAKKKREAGLKQTQTPPVTPFVPTDPRTKLQVTTLPNKKRTTKSKTDKTGFVRQLGGNFFGKNNDDGPDSSMMNFRPAKYPDPLDLDKYKGAAQRVLKGPSRQ